MLAVVEGAAEIVEQGAAPGIAEAVVDLDAAHRQIASADDITIVVFRTHGFKIEAAQRAVAPGEEPVGGRKVIEVRRGGRAQIAAQQQAGAFC